MSEVKWIKITTNIFDDEKIKLIETLPEGDSVLVIWLKLLTMAGKVNDGGLIYLTKDIPYNEEMLSTIIHRPVNIIRLALDTFVKMGMVKVFDGFIDIVKWERHQNIEGLEKIKEQSRISSQKYRENQKKLIESDMIVTSRDQTDKNRIEEDKNKNRIDKDIYHQNKYFTVTVNKHNQYGNKYKLADIDTEYEFMERWLDNKGADKIKDYNKFIHNWLRKTNDKIKDNAPEDYWGKRYAKKN